MGAPCLVLSGYALLSILSSIVIILKRKRELVALIVFLMPCDCQCPVALHHGGLCWPMVCECGIS